MMTFWHFFGIFGTFVDWLSEAFRSWNQQNSINYWVLIKKEKNLRPVSARAKKLGMTLTTDSCLSKASNEDDDLCEIGWTPPN